ncbi:hypothetical protein [Xanthomonas sp. 3307]|nr:hypothetical protein [Xanthomonas sp. 3307]
MDLSLQATHAPAAVAFRVSQVCMTCGAAVHLDRRACVYPPEPPIRACCDACRADAGVRHPIVRESSCRMHPVIHFRSRLFEVSAEPENPINPIRGSSLLDWLRVRVGHAMVLSEPDPEDWGWASEAECQGRSYLVGAYAEEEVDGNHTWMLQIEKQRSFWERILGRHAMRDDDPCFAQLHALIAAEPRFTEVVVEREP